MPLQLVSQQSAFDTISKWPEYEPSPLRSEPAVAAALGIGSLWLKDETRRFGVGSFKALGGAYAVEKLSAGNTSVQEFATASAGNHGIGLAWGCSRKGHACHVFLDAAVPEGSADKIRRFGGTVHRVSGGYEASVDACKAAAAANGWAIVQDGSEEGYTAIPHDIFAGYSVLATEMLQQLEGNGEPLPTHVLVNAGVGGLASSMCASFWSRFGEARPIFISVEPSAAACCFHSAASGRMLQAPVMDETTIMVGLDCKVPTRLAWDVLETGCDAFVTVGDEVVEPCQQLLDELHPPLPSGESAVAGLGALIAAAAQPELKQALSLDADSRVAMIICEGPTR